MKPTPALRNLLLGIVLHAVAHTANAAALIWDGGGGDANWNTGDNWDTNFTPISTSDITFNSTVTGTISTTMGVAYTVNSLVFTSAQTSSVTINTDNTKALTIGGGAATDISVQAGSHTFMGTNGGSNTPGDLFFTNGTTNVINIADTASLTIQARVRNVSGNTVTMQKTGLGTLVLSGNNGGTGGWTLSSAFAVQQGVLRFAATSAYGNSGNQYTVSSGAALELSGGVNQNNTSGTITLNGTGISGNGALRSLSGANAITNIGSIVLNTVGTNSIGVDAGSLSIANVISGTTTTRELAKVGAGKLVLTGDNTYLGATNINNGILEIAGTGDINQSSGITVNGGHFKYNSSTNLTAPLTFTSGTVSGTNLAGVDLTIGTGQSISPGNSPGTMAVDDQTWASGGTYLWEMYNATGSAGTGWDLLSGTGTLNITATSGGTFTIDLTSLSAISPDVFGNAINFDMNANNAWLIADFNAVSNFAADAFDIDATGFSNPLNGNFGISLGGVGAVPGDNSQVYLTYTAIPEPGALILGSFGLLAFLRRRR